MFSHLQDEDRCVKMKRERFENLDTGPRLCSRDTESIYDERNQATPDCLDKNILLTLRFYPG